MEAWQDCGGIQLLEINTQPSKSELRLFSLLLVPFSILIGYLVDHYFGPGWAAWTLAGVLMLIGIVGSFLPPAARWLFVGWMIVAFPIGWTISHAVMALVFFGLFLPVGLIARWFGYDPLQIHQKKAGSYWQPLEPVTDKERYFRQF